MSDNNLKLDVEQIIQRRKDKFLAESRKQVSVQEWIAQSVPWWLIIVAAGLFALSAGHTAGVFSQLSSIGYAGPFVVEFALLWAAFGRVSKRESGGRTSVILRALEVLAFVMAIFANGVGAAERIAVVSNIGAFSFARLVEQLGALPFTTQAVIFLVPLFALFIPIGTWVAGEGLAELFLLNRSTGSLQEARWNERKTTEVYDALFLHEIENGARPNDARRRAQAIVRGMSQGAIPMENDGITETPELPNGKTKLPKGEAQRRLDALLLENSEAVRLPPEQLMELTGVGKSAVYAWRASKVKSNGHLVEE